MASFFAIPTLAGQAALAAALNGEGDITIAEMVVGDGNGSPTTPLETQTTLVHVVATVPISSATRAGNVTTFDALLDENTGGFMVREAGLLDDDGQLLFVASTAETEKLTTAQNAFDVLTLGLQVIVSETANVTLQPPPGSLVSIAEQIRAPFITVDSATLASPPGSPASDNCYLVPAGAGGAWVGNANNLAQWNGEAWVFKIVPVTHLIGVADTGQYLKRTATGWVEVFLPIFRTSRAALLFYGMM
ncbi:MAG: phage tail protein [Aurantimonas coralicida]|nr:phage tail protein [Aurantimonas coralicida]